MDQLAKKITLAELKELIFKSSQDELDYLNAIHGGQSRSLLRSKIYEHEAAMEFMSLMGRERVSRAMHDVLMDVVDSTDS